MVSDCGAEGTSHSAAYVKGMERLLPAVQELSLARDIEGVQRVVRSAARELTGADGATFVLRDGPNCFYADEDAISPLWKGRRFPLETCISGWSMLNRQPAVIPDIYEDARIPADAYRPTFVQSLVMVPIRTVDPVGAIGNYWAKKRQPSEEEVRLLQALADCTSIAIENIRNFSDLEQRVRDRTAELQRAHDAIHKLAITDELTGLCNRRGFYLLAEQELRHAARRVRPCVLVFMDLDGLKSVNDAFGHGQGDAMLIAMAEVLRSTFRSSDVIGRTGGDEFCALALDSADGASVRVRVQEHMERYNGRAGAPYRLWASVGVVEVPPGNTSSLDELLADADQAMYCDKRQRGDTRGSSVPPALMASKTQALDES
jgi:diguanylate cyclase (GGDEF)-like protein